MCKEHVIEVMGDSGRCQREWSYHVIGVEDWQRCHEGPVVHRTATSAAPQTVVATHAINFEAFQGLLTLPWPALPPPSLLCLM